MKKGDLVQLDEKVCFTKDQGGGLDYPYQTYGDDSRGTVTGKRPMTESEIVEWYATPGNRGLDSAGEPTLPSRTVHIPLHRDRVYQVLRARCRVALGYGNPRGGMAKLLCTHSGEEVYVDRTLLRVI